jgi:hypothetical protein
MYLKGLSFSDESRGQRIFIEVIWRGKESLDDESNRDLYESLILCGWNLE